MAIDKQKLSKEVKDKYSLANETFSRCVKDNPKDRIEVEIGDSKQPDFKPQFKVMRWDNEVNFSMRATEHPAAVVETKGEVIKYKTPDYEVHQYDKPEVSEDGGFEFEWVLPKKPASNVLTATIQTKGLDFFYQPALTAEEVANGASRPDNVVGSYAVYHKTKGGINDAAGMDYKVGKAFHIYRPEAKDANGTKVWCELNVDIDSGVLSVTVPQSFLDSAVYPVMVDPTFGYTSIGATTPSATTWGGRFTAPGGGNTVTSVSMYWLSVEAADSQTVAIYTNSANQAQNLLSNSTSQSLGDPDGWYTATITWPTDGSVVYILSWTNDSAANAASDTGGATGQRAYGWSGTYPTWIDPLDELVDNNIPSIYATYIADPVVTTQNVTNITTVSATGNGTVVSEGDSSVTERGVCWNTTGYPTTSDSKATTSGTTGAYSVSITGLTAGTRYYARAYAINADTTGYGNMVSFDTAINLAWTTA